MANGRKTGGRVRGTPNKINGDIKAMILTALQTVGGTDYLAARAIDTPTAFMALLGKILPLQLTGEEGTPLAIDFRWADATPQQTHEPEALNGAEAGFDVTFANETTSSRPSNR